ncbi:acetyl-CoA carboxylase biotin carboxyl carrier protein [Paenibacillus popilliae]|uniref:Biotin carboxyl carrier protein of acetyl-CoA carboxylase n=1 Tax=Paenibacillus popilliae ATCC 14706 TaxID=1212764 RepID=M9M6B8_PAEPP|nr:acetyl-CoA carboxylase biotin carboxyl carrier protein [Paenibacillus popilliae]GAC43033.1 biotin carboxyl carrier protein [Paenibacillus popilliae ATCC 14706]
MFKISEIKELIKLLDQTSVHELEIENEGCRIAIRKPGKTEVFNVQTSAAPLTYAAPAPATASVSSEALTPAAEPQPEKKEEQTGLIRIVSPMVGTFYSTPSPEAPPYVKVGDKINENTVVGILEAMKLMNQLEAEVKGEIVEVLATNGQLVEFGQPLFLVKPE